MPFWQLSKADLLRLCESEEITPETFIEVAIVLLQFKPELKEVVVADADAMVQFARSVSEGLSAIL